MGYLGYGSPSCRSCFILDLTSQVTNYATRVAFRLRLIGCLQGMDRFCKWPHLTSAVVAQQGGAARTSSLRLPEVQIHLGICRKWQQKEWAQVAMDMAQFTSHFDCRSTCNKKETSENCMF